MKPVKEASPQMIAAQEEWNKFAQEYGPEEMGGNGWVKRFNDKRATIIHDFETGMITDTIRDERLKEHFDENRPLSQRFIDVRKALFSREALPAYKQSVDRYNKIVKPIPYWASLIDETEPTSPFHEANKNNRTIFTDTSYRGDKKGYAN